MIGATRDLPFVPIDAVERGAAESVWRSAGILSVIIAGGVTRHGKVIWLRRDEPFPEADKILTIPGVRYFVYATAVEDTLLTVAFDATSPEPRMQCWGSPVGDACEPCVLSPELHEELFELMLATKARDVYTRLRQQVTDTEASA